MLSSLEKFKVLAAARLGDKPLLSEQDWLVVDARHLDHMGENESPDAFKSALVMDLYDIYLGEFSERQRESDRFTLDQEMLAFVEKHIKFRNDGFDSRATLSEKFGKHAYSMLGSVSEIEPSISCRSSDETGDENASEIVDPPASKKNAPPNGFPYCVYVPPEGYKVVCTYSGGRGGEAKTTHGTLYQLYDVDDVFKDEVFKLVDDATGKPYTPDEWEVHCGYSDSSKAWRKSTRLVDLDMTVRDHFKALKAAFKAAKGAKGAKPPGAA